MQNAVILSHLKAVPASLGRVWRWWIGELRAAGASITERMGWTSGHETRMTPEEAGFAIHIYRRGNLESDTGWTPLDGNPPPANGAVILEVPADRTLTHLLTFPDAVQSDLASAAELQISRLSPVPVAQIAWALGTPSPGSQPDTVTVPVTLLLRSTVDPWLETLRAQSVRVDRLETPDHARFEVPGVGLTPTERRWFPIARTALAITAVGGLLAIGALWQHRLDEESAWLEDTLSHVRRAAAEDVSLRARLERDVAVAQRLAAASKEPDPVRLIATINEQLPQEMWIQSIEIAGREAKVIAYVPARADIGHLLLSLPGVLTVTEDARVPLGVGIGMERIDLSLTLRDGAAT